ncbi:MAG: GDP-L-fucose synthase [bacterium]|nr:GDP-L-fucose synthase [bacterium]
MRNGPDIKRNKILVTGGSGFLGSFVVERLQKRGVPKKNIFVPRSKKYDLRKLENCQKVVKGQDIVIHLAAKVGGIGFNRAKPGELFYDNIIIGAQLMEAARLAGVKKFVAIGTICAYPKFTPIPFREENLWNGYPEETNAPYGLAKKMLLVQAQAYRQQYNFNAIYLLPVNLYGPGDKFDPAVSHVIPALIHKIFEAKRKKQKSVEVWGMGRATREFLYVEDAAEGIIMAVDSYNGNEPINLGSGAEISIRNLVRLICQLAGYKGKVIWNKDKPDGQPRRMLDTSRAKKEFDFKARTDFREGLQKTIDWYIKNR